MRRLVSIPGITFGLFVLWKVGLLILAAQPVPTTDSFFYDGPVVNYLLHGNYYNPALSQMLPISGNEVFCAYPPLYQGVLLCWMKCLGTSAIAAMWLHVTMLVIFAVVMLVIFLRIKGPTMFLNVAGLFLFSITFHDRPDTLAQCLGLFAIMAWLFSCKGHSKCTGGLWDWLMTLAVILSLCASIQFGLVFICWVWLLVLGRFIVRRDGFALLPLLATMVIPVVLVAWIRIGHPLWWAGFMEHAAQTPGAIGLRTPNILDLLKVVRAVPGVVAVVLALLVIAVRAPKFFAEIIFSNAGLLLLGSLAAVFAMLVAGLTSLSPNYLPAASWIQPLVVGVFLILIHQKFILWSERWSSVVLVALAIFGAIRAVGISTWGVACSQDVSHADAVRLVREAVDETPTNSTIAVSGPFLYEAIRASHLRVIHSDWLAPVGTASQSQNIIALRPAKMILTQLDYWRSYRITVLPELGSYSNLLEIKVTDMAHRPVPDSSPTFQKMFPNVSWAPVILEFTWK